MDLSLFFKPTTKERETKKNLDNDIPLEPDTLL
jgi:hypothetical protein